jgi:hypothetical protein
MRPQERLSEHYSWHSQQICYSLVVIPEVLAALRPRLLPEVEDWRADHPDPASVLLGAGTTALVAGLLAAHLDEPLRFSELELRTGQSHESVYRAVGRLEAAGVVRVERGTRRNAVVMRRSSLALTLRALTLRGGPLFSALDWAGAVRGRIDEAFVFGSFAAGTDSSDSDIDVFVIGEIRVTEVAHALTGVGDMLRREVNPVVRTRGHVVSRLEAGYGFYEAVWRGPRITLVEGVSVSLPSRS